MGTHPIFESDFDCLTDMRNLIVYRMVNGNPVRLLSATTKLRGGHGNYHEGDQPKPKEFLEAAAFLTEAQRPSVIRLTEEDMTPEFKAEKAKKYNMLPEDYYPLSIQQAGNSGGDYPVMVEESYFCRPANYEWDHMLHRMNWGRPIGKYELTRQGQAGVVFDGHYHPYGYWQYWQHFKLYFLTWFAVMLGIPLVANYWEAYAPVRVSDDHWTHHKACAVKSGKLFYERWFSHSELEFKDVMLKMQQAKLGSLVNLILNQCQKCIPEWLICIWLIQEMKEDIDMDQRVLLIFTLNIKILTWFQLVQWPSRWVTC